MDQRLLVAMNTLPNFLSIALLAISPVYVLLSLVAISSRIVSFLGILASHGKTLTTTSDWWSIHVPKRSFTHFYLFGLLSATILLHAWNESILSPSWAEILLFVHLSRRLYECLYVHQFRPESQMNLAGYLLGIGHYLILPLGFAGRSTRADDNVLVFACCVWNIWMQYEQYVHHRILAELRQQKPTSRPAYSLPPNQRWFRWSLCPHYLAEIMIYASWAVLLAQQKTFPLAELPWLSSMLPWFHTLLQQAAAQRHWFLFLWVATNLTVSALNNRDWYQSRYSRLSKSALFPWPYKWR
jgi:hypothetical protein